MTDAIETMPSIGLTIKVVGATAAVCLLQICFQTSGFAEADGARSPRAANSIGESQPNSSSEKRSAPSANEPSVDQQQGFDTFAAPIPPVVTGSIELEEIKPTNVIDVKVAQSRTFKLKNKIVRTAISDPGIAEPVVIAENQFILLGKSTGSCTLFIWDDAGNMCGLNVVVRRDYGPVRVIGQELNPSAIVKPITVGGTDRIIQMGDVDHVESAIRSFSAGNVATGDRGMNVQTSNNRIMNTRIGETGAGGNPGGR